MASLTIALPDDVGAALDAAGYGPERLSLEARHHLAAYLFEQKVLSLGAAARMADMSLWDFIPFLGEQRIEEEARGEVESARWMSGLPRPGGVVVRLP